ncbi:hypothetical protein F4803DRAFT_550464 [Xylaria telfairii]|nr:hypothetical protein F4803DRAFT_550464 [Xylaria telfairii]
MSEITAIGGQGGSAEAGAGGSATGGQGGSASVQSSSINADNSSSDGVSSSVIVGIVVVVLVLNAAAGLTFWLYRRRQRSRKSQHTFTKLSDNDFSYRPTGDNTHQPHIVSFTQSPPPIEQYQHRNQWREVTVPTPSPRFVTPAPELPLLEAPEVQTPESTALMHLGSSR